VPAYTAAEIQRVIRRLKAGERLQDIAVEIGRRSTALGTAVHRLTGRWPNYYISQHRNGLKARARKLESEGMHPTEIGRQVGRSRSQVDEWLKGKRVNGLAKQQAIRQERNDLIVALYLNGMRPKEIGTSIELSEPMVWQILQKDPRTTLGKPKRRVTPEVVNAVIARCEQGELLRVVVAEYGFSQSHMSTLIRQRLGRSLREHLQLRKQRATVTE